MTPFELVEPASLSEAIALLDPEDPSVRPIAGGTALMLLMKAGVFRPRRLVSLRKLAPLHSGITSEKNGALAIGAMTPLAAVERSAEVARIAPVIPRMMRRLSNIRVRVIGPDDAAERRIGIEDLFTGYFETVLAKNELIAGLHIPPQGRSRSAYAKVTTGSAEDWPALGVAVALEAEGATVKSARVVISAATERATRLKGVERLLIGANIDEKTLARAGDAAADEAECVSDVRGSAAYKRELTRVHVNRALHQALNS